MSDDPASVEAWQEQEKSDIVARLRVINHHTKKLAENEGLHYVHREAFTRCEDLTWEAANEIERLRKRLLAEENAYDIMRIENEHLQTDRNNLALEIERLNACIERLRAERDEARRYSCDLEARIIVLEEDRRDTSNKFGTNPCSEIILPDYPLAREPKEIAKQKGWDCFKENTNG